MAKLSDDHIANPFNKEELEWGRIFTLISETFTQAPKEESWIWKVTAMNVRAANYLMPAHLHTRITLNP